MKETKEPKDIEDLQDIFYNSQRKEDKKRYQDNFRTKIISPNLEKDSSKIFKSLNLKKIKEKKRIKTFDFKDENAKVLAEVTTIDFGDESNLSTMNVSTKIKTAVDHLGEKDSSEFSDYSRGGLIVYSSSLAFLREDLVGKIVDESFIKNLMKQNNLQYILFRPQESSMGGKASISIFPTILYVKKEHRDRFTQLPDETKIKEIVT